MTEEHLVQSEHDGNDERLEAAPKLSDVDRAIIRALEEDGRCSFARIAKDIGSSERRVRTRVKELRDDGIIKITAIADPDLLGYGLIAMLGVSTDPSRSLSAIVAELAELPGAFYVMAVAGRYNALVEISCADLDELLSLIDHELAAVAGVIDVEVHPYHRLHYQDPAFEGPRRDDRDPPAERAPFGEVDRAIITHLSDDGRRPFQHIARDLGVSESQVRQRVKRMKLSGSLRVMALTNPAGLGFKWVALIGVTMRSGADVEAVAAQFARLSSVKYVAICAGRFGLLVEALCTDQTELLRVLHEEIQPIPGVERAEPWVYLQLHYRRVKPH
jgi:Lrp/AsnC family transcriptional regulator for asnA, asnC and gidA